MNVCACNDIDFDTILEAVKKVGFELDTIRDETDAGTSCECCLEEGCDMVDLSLPLAIAKAKTLLGS